MPSLSSLNVNAKALPIINTVSDLHSPPPSTPSDPAEKITTVIENDPLPSLNPAALALDDDRSQDSHKAAPVTPSPSSAPQSVHILLPSYTPSSSDHFIWSNLMSGEDFSMSVNAAYEEIVHWRPNLFSPPSGKAGNSFTDELAKLFRAYGESSGGLEQIALKAAMVLPSILLQKPHQGSKSRDHRECLSRRLSLWLAGDINNLIIEGRTIQCRIQSHRPSNNIKNNNSRLFSKLMFQGKTKDALRLLSSKQKGSPLNIHSAISPTNPHHTIFDELMAKHPPSQPAKPEALLCSPLPPSHPIIFDSLQGCSIRDAALHTNGAAGPSGLDASAWRRLCTCFHKASDNLCNSLALVARKICTTFVDPQCLTPFTACRLIALDKCPGVRPIGVCEVARRIISKAILSTIKPEIQEAAGTLQLCAGQEAGCEAAVHALSKIFQDDNTEGALLLDASNAFNNLNRQVALHNIQIVCPSLAKILINTYRIDTQLFIDRVTLLSREGTTQGDPLAMAMFALASIPLINSLSSKPKQVWYADDAAAGGNIADLAEWWSSVCHRGPAFGYFVNPAKTCLVVKKQHLQHAIDTFSSTGITISCDGARYLGAPLGSPEFIQSFVSQKVDEWKSSIETLSSFATSQPHAAYCAMTHGLSSQWLFLQRTIPNLSTLLQPLEDTISNVLIPAITGRKCCSALERDLFALPARLGGLGLTNPTASATHQHTASTSITAPLSNAILAQSTILSQSMLNDQMSAKQTTHRIRRQLANSAASQLLSRVDDNTSRAINLASEKGASSWLTALPIEEHGFALHKGAFRDALSLRYNWIPSNIPAKCVCNKPFSVDHALSCPTGGFPSIRHNELRDITAEALTEVCHNVCTEPHLQPLTGESLNYASANSQDGARLDIRASGFWGSRFEQAFFDVRVFNPNASSYRQLQLSTAYSRHEQLKRRQYEQRIREVEHGSFTPLVFSTSGGIGKSAKIFYKRLASMIADKREAQYATTMTWLRCRLSFSLLRAAITCLRGSRSSHHNPCRDTHPDLAVSEGRL